GRDHEAFGIRRQRFGDQLFAHVRTIGISCVYEVDAQLSGLAKNRKRGVWVPGRPPDSVAGNTHGAETEAVYGQSTAQPYGPTGTRERTAWFVVHLHSSKVFLFTRLLWTSVVAWAVTAAPRCEIGFSGRQRRVRAAVDHTRARPTARAPRRSLLR